MKKQAGIDLSSLTHAQKTMLVKLLATNNVEVSHNKDSYFATLKVPTSSVCTYLNTQNDQSIKSASKEVLQDQKNKPCKVKNEKQVAYKSKKTGSKVVMSSKKKLFKAVKLPPIPRLQILSPFVEVYIYPKKLTLPQLEQLIQQIYQQYQYTLKENIQSNLVECFYKVVCQHTGTGSKQKNDQCLVNSLETLNHFQYKVEGVKFFVQILAQKRSKQQLDYFIVLRALVEEILGEKILIPKSKFTSFSQTPTFNASKNRIKWNPFNQELPEEIVIQFINISCSSPIEQKFTKLTQRMYYCQQKKQNYITFYSLVDFMLQQFQAECARSRQQTLNESTNRISHNAINHDALNLSYSQNQDSALNQILLEYSCTQGSKLKTKFQMDLIFDRERSESQQQKQNMLLEFSVLKARQMCKKVCINEEETNKICKKVQSCVQSITSMDKIKWVKAMGLTGNQQQLFFIQQLQLEYRNLCETGSMVKNLARRIFGGPGFVRLFTDFIYFCFEGFVIQYNICYEDDSEYVYTIRNYFHQRMQLHAQGLEIIKETDFCLIVTEEAKLKPPA